MSFDIPESWVLTTIEDMAKYVQRGKAPKYVDWSNLPVVNQKSIRWHGIEIEHLKFIHPEQWNKWNEERFLQDGDVLWNSTGIGTIGRATIYQGILGYEKAVVDSHVTVIRIQNYNQKLLHYWIMSPTIQSKINKMHVCSTAQVELSRSEVLKTLIPLPPLNEQHRIVAKIEALMARSQRAKEALDAIPPLLDQFRQSVLTAAFSGNLTADWREKNLDVEPAAVLLERIREERKQQTKGKLNKLESFDSSEMKIEQLPEIPGSWCWIYFGELVASIRSGSTAVPQDEVSNYPILRSSSVRPGLVDLEDIRYLTKDQSLNEDNFLCNEDLLFTRLSGSLSYVGNCAVVRNLNGQHIQYPYRLFRAKLLNTKYSIYSEFCFASPLLRALIARNAKSSAGHQRISMGVITEAPIPFPPQAEQNEIVHRVQTFFKAADQIEQQYQQARAYLDQLDQSILAKAFRGELVPQDPKDEPASVLLERIRAERAKREAGAKVAKKSTGNSSGRRGRKAKQQDSEAIQLGLPGVD